MKTFTYVLTENTKTATKQIRGETQKVIIILLFVAYYIHLFLFPPFQYEGICHTFDNSAAHSGPSKFIAMSGASTLPNHIMKRKPSSNI